MEWNKKLNWWQLALLSVAVSGVGGLSSMKPHKTERKLYEKDLKQAPWAPPGWLFAPAWTINNFFILKALQQILQRKGLDKRKKLLVLQSIIWFIFFSYGYVYFNKKSTLLSALWTISDAALATSSFVISRREDKDLSLLYAPLMCWTSFASTIAVYQALTNKDPLLHFNPKKQMRKIEHLVY